MGSRVRVPPRSPKKSNTYCEISEGLFPNFAAGKRMGSGNVPQRTLQNLGTTESRSRFRGMAHDNRRNESPTRSADD
jgi:hypothetical protein